MSPEQAWVKENADESILKCLKALKKNNFEGHYFSSGAKALNYILWSIPPWVSVGFGDSETVEQIGLPGALHDRGQKLISSFWEDDPRIHVLPKPGKAFRVGKEAIQADYFISGINAITLDGEIVNIDAGGNRVAGTIYGPGKVIMVAGTNKIVNNVEEAIERIKKVAAPLNARRHMEHGIGNLIRSIPVTSGAKRPSGPPCALTGECFDCDTCLICCYTVILEHQLYPRIEVILVGEELGL